MQVCKFSLQLHQSAVGTRDVTRSSRASTHGARGGAHRVDDLRMLAHAEIVVRTPYNDISAAARTVPERMGELPRFALQVGEDAITALSFQRSNGRLETPVIVEHSWSSFGDRVHLLPTLLTQLGIIRRAPGLRRAARLPSPLARAGRGPCA